MQWVLGRRLEFYGVEKGRFLRGFGRLLCFFFTLLSFVLFFSVLHDALFLGGAQAWSGMVNGFLGGFVEDVEDRSLVVMTKYGVVCHATRCLFFFDRLIF